jgi:hypothetical protein
MYKCTCVPFLPLPLTQQSNFSKDISNLLRRNRLQTRKETRQKKVFDGTFNTTYFKEVVNFCFNHLCKYFRSVCSCTCTTCHPFPNRKRSVPYSPTETGKELQLYYDLMTIYESVLKGKILMKNLC